MNDQQYDAVAFLQSLTATGTRFRAPCALDDDELSCGFVQPEDLPEEWYEEWGERAAIRQFDGGQAKEHAEAEAFTEILARMRKAEYHT